MDKKEIEQKRNEAIETAKKNDEIYYTSDIEGFKKGFDTAVKLFSMHFVSNSETAVCSHKLYPTHGCPLEYKSCIDCRYKIEQTDC